MRICIVSITVLLSVPMVAASYAVAATTVTNDVIFTNPARSIHWKTRAVSIRRCHYHYSSVSVPYRTGFWVPIVGFALTDAGNAES